MRIQIDFDDAEYTLERTAGCDWYDWYIGVDFGATGYMIWCRFEDGMLMPASQRFDGERLERVPPPRSWTTSVSA